jgi:UDP:flavonoid glycosyltransferase YjiC (YdhE family)
VRVLLGCSIGGEGHLGPLANVGRALERTGHESMLVVPPALEQSAQRTGLRYRAGDEPPRAFVDEIWRRVRSGPEAAVAGLIDRELFAERCTQAMLPAVRETRDAWRPELIVREPCEYATAVAAHEAGIAQAQVAISLAAIEFDVRAMVASIIDRFSPGAGAAIAAAPYLSSFPPSLDPSPWPDTRRFQIAQAPGARWSGWGTDDRRPLVYVTFGTVLGHLPEASGVYRTALDAVAELPARVLLTVGRATDVASLGPLPENTRVEQWVPQAAVLEEAALVVCHGGSGTTFGALAAGVPVVVCPLFADQARNGQAVQRAAVGVTVGVPEHAAGGLRGLGPEDVAGLRAAVERVLGEPAYRAAAGRVAAEIAGLPAIDEVVAGLGPSRRGGAR